jgi:hypothetical protein
MLLLPEHQSFEMILLKTLTVGMCPLPYSHLYVLEEGVDLRHSALSIFVKIKEFLRLRFHQAERQPLPRVEQVLLGCSISRIDFDKTRSLQIQDMDLQDSMGL